MKYSRFSYGLAAVAMLSVTWSTQAAPQLTRASRSQSTAVDLGTPGQSPNAGSIDDDCTSGGFNLGMLSRFMTIQADTTGLTDDFDEQLDCAPAPCGYYTNGTASDGIATFQVPVTGSWRFASCGGVVYDSALAIREGGACPGTNCVGQDDDSCAGCAGPYEARLTVNLTAGNTYYLIVDGWSGGGNVDMVVSGPCTVPADCDDGIFCNGAELCTAGRCAAAAAAPCSGATPFCNEATDTCFGCNTDADCEDNIFCNGDSACVNGACSPQSGNPCSAITVCNEATDACDNLDPCLSFLGQPFSGGTFLPQCFNACDGARLGEDIKLSDHTSRDLVSYTVNWLARDLHTNPGCTNDGAGSTPHPVGTPYTVTTELYTVQSNGICLPDQPIPGTQCVFQFQVMPTGSPADVAVCSPNAGMPTGIVLPTGESALGCIGGSNDGTPCTSDGDCTGGGLCQAEIAECNVDFFIVVKTNGAGGAGPPLTNLGGIIGSTPLQPFFGQEVYLFEDCGVNPGTPDGTFVFSASGANGNFKGVSVCTEPLGGCCDAAAGTCNELTQTACEASGGAYLGDIFSDGSGGACDAGTDTDGDGSRDECDLCDNDAGKTAPGQCGCGIADTDTDADGTANCNDGCPNDPAKVAPGACGCGNSDQDSDLDGTADCQDGCPDDANKTDPGTCGCGVAETGDSDGDGVADCIDVCPGVDDSVFAPGCVGAIPTVSEWGMIVLGLLLLVGAKVYFGRKPELG